ncbi:Sodium- and chloride-dependent glycine transporter 2 [Halotydeus destructor]|nr:Sodium- and chloride-dependent glycine transporter 2 [Halotydeus destructor]
MKEKEEAIRSNMAADDDNNNGKEMPDGQVVIKVKGEPANGKPDSAALKRTTSTSSIESRGSWGNKWEFLLSCVGLSVGIGNVWRFPYLAYENGGGAFLIPYLVMLFLAGKPMYFMELALGQFGGTGPLAIWRCAPIMKGVGAAMVACSVVVCIYYNVIMSYALFFIGQAIQSPLPWTRCDVPWAEDTNCVVREKNMSVIMDSDAKSSSQVFWERKVLELSTGIDDLGGIKWDLAACLAISWLIVILCLAKGVKTSGKVVYFAATFPYAILLTLLVTGLMQEGAWEGVKYFITPDFNKLFTIKVWQAAASQMFFSLSVSMGGLVMYSSYNKFDHDIFHDAMVVSVLDTVTSVISGLVIFSVLGAMSHELGIDISEVVKGGPGLAFVAYPEALARLPCPQLWSILFFLMLFILGLDSEFALLENVITSIADEVEYVRRHKMKFTVAMGVVFFLIGLPCVTRGGQYVFEIMDYYGGSIPLLFIAVFECIGLMWVYGFDNFAFDINFMLQRSLGLYWRITWKYTAPVVLAFITVYSLAHHTPLNYGGYDFPDWADIIGWTLTTLIVGQIPAWACFAILRQKKTCSFPEKVQLACEQWETWGPRDDKTRRDWRSKKTNIYSAAMLSQIISDEFDSKNPAKLKKFEKVSSDNQAFESNESHMTSPQPVAILNSASMNFGYEEENSL